MTEVAVLSAVRTAVGTARKGALANDGTAIWYYAWALRNGRGVATDKAQAVVWYQRAVDQNIAGGIYELANMYEFGEAGPADLQKAIELYRRSADLGFGDGMRAMGN